MSILAFTFGYLYFPKTATKDKLQLLKQRVDFVGIILFSISLSSWMIFFMVPSHHIGIYFNWVYKFNRIYFIRIKIC